jgi:sugar/nucleoside kinase (ribokinase family)
VGYDNFGNNYIDNLKLVGINPIFKKTSGKSGICHILVTPDGERTNIASIEVSGDFPAIERLEGLNPKIFHTSGYEIASNPEKCEEIIDYFKNKKIKISFDPASRSTIKQKRKSIEKIVGKSDILFVTEEEAKELIDLPPFKALKELSKTCKVVALKRGSKGSVVRKNNQQYKIPVYPSKLINTCGAGDSYATGFLFAYIQKLPLEECGRFASYIASRVCSKEESHL